MKQMWSNLIMGRNRCEKKTMSRNNRNQLQKQAHHKNLQTRKKPRSQLAENS